MVPQKLWMVCQENPDVPFISADEVATKQVRVKVILKIGGVALDVDRFFTVTVIPGFPVAIAVIDPPENRTICVPNGEELPDVTVACFDENGNRTGPMRNVKWNVFLADNGPLSTNVDSWPVLADGTATLSHLLALVDDVGSGTVASHEVSLEWRLPGNSQRLTPPRAISASLRVNIIPGQKPESVEVSRAPPLILYAYSALIECSLFSMR
jgi:hypothetical protein